MEASTLGFLSASNVLFWSLSQILIDTNRHVIGLRGPNQKIFQVPFSVNPDL